VVEGGPKGGQLAPGVVGHPCASTLATLTPWEIPNRHEPPPFSNRLGVAESQGHT